VTLKSQAQWLDVVKTNGCYTCHQLGNKATRTIPKDLGHFTSSTEAWARRIVSGQAMTQMTNNIGRLDARRALALFADWTDRIAAGELPASKPTRPEGIERSVVVTLWDWAGPKDYLHDEVSTDKRNPRVNANGLIYGATEESRDLFPVLDPVSHKATQVKMPVRDPNTPSSKQNPMTPSPYWGDEPIWDSQTSMHNPMFDEKGRSGSPRESVRRRIPTSAREDRTIRPPGCSRSTSPTATSPCTTRRPEDHADQNVLPHAPPGVRGGCRQHAVDQRRRAAERRHRLAEQEDVRGDRRRGEIAGWTALILDTNGNGKRDDYVEPNQPLDPTKDKRVVAAFYGIAVSPVDGTIWGTVLGFPGYVIRLNPGPNPPATALAEVFEPPFPGYGPRGMDVDRSGVVWTPLSSGHLASFDRRRCKGPLNGPTATGQHCPEGWTLHPFPGPQLQTVTDPGSAEATYYTWVDQHDTFGLGTNVPIATGNANEALLAFVNGKFVTLRVPYPMGFYTKWMDGRIDDPKGGWKGKGLWATYSTERPSISRAARERRARS